MNTFVRVVNPALVGARRHAGQMQVALGRTPAGPSDVVPPDEDATHRPLFMYVSGTTDFPALKATLLAWLNAHLQSAGVDISLGYCVGGNHQPVAAKNPATAARGDVPTCCARINPDLVQICESTPEDRSLSLGFPAEPVAGAVRVVLAPEQAPAEARAHLLTWLTDHLRACGVYADLLSPLDDAVGLRC